MNEELNRLSCDIWGFAELKFDEHKSAEVLKNYLKGKGFRIEENLADIPTAFSASFGNGSPVIAILGEFDALSGLSQESDSFVAKKVDGMENGHGCGHHLLGVGSAGAAVKVKEYIEENGISGTVIFYGCPGEEGGSGKAFMVNREVFNDVDAAITWHPFNTNGIFTGSLLANKQVYVKFRGKSSHAAAGPHLGRSALDGLEVLNIGIQFLREHIEDKDRIHYAITNTGGISPNVVQNYAEGIYLIRSKNSETVEKLYERFENIVKGAALITETEAEIVFDKSCSEIVTNRTIEEALYESFLKCGACEYTKDEIDYANRFRDTVSNEDISSEYILNMTPNPKEVLNKFMERPLCDFVVPYMHTDEVRAGSSDMGDVSTVVPTSQIMAACFAIGTPVHSWQEVAQGKSSIALKGMNKASDVMADTAIKLLTDSDLLKRAKVEFEEKTKNRVSARMPSDAMPLGLRK